MLTKFASTESGSRGSSPTSQRRTGTGYSTRWCMVISSLKLLSKSASRFAGSASAGRYAETFHLLRRLTDHMRNSNMNERTSGYTSSIPSGAPDTRSGTCTTKLPISSYTSLAPTLLSSKVISTTASLPTIVPRPHRLRLTSPLAPWPAPLVRRRSARSVPSRATSSSGSRAMISRRS